MSSTRTEGAVQGEILGWLRQQPDVFALRIQANGAGNKGVSDCILCYRGRFVALEFKRDLNGTYGVTKPQEIRGRKIKKAGGLWYAVDSLEQVKGILGQIGTEA